MIKIKPKLQKVLSAFLAIASITSIAAQIPASASIYDGSIGDAVYADGGSLENFSLDSLDDTADTLSEAGDNSLKNSLALFGSMGTIADAWSYSSLTVPNASNGSAVGGVTNDAETVVEETYEGDYTFNMKFDSADDSAEYVISRSGTTYTFNSENNWGWGKGNYSTTATTDDDPIFYIPSSESDEYGGHYTFNTLELSSNPLGLDVETVTDDTGKTKSILSYDSLFDVSSTLVLREDHAKQPSVNYYSDWIGLSYRELYQGSDEEKKEKYGVNAVGTWGVDRANSALASLYDFFITRNDEVNSADGMNDNPEASYYNQLSVFYKAVDETTTVYKITYKNDGTTVDSVEPITWNIKDVQKIKKAVQNVKTNFENSEQTTEDLLEVIEEQLQFMDTYVWWVEIEEDEYNSNKDNDSYETYGGKYYVKQTGSSCIDAAFNAGYQSFYGIGVRNTLNRIREEDNNSGWAMALTDSDKGTLSCTYKCVGKNAAGQTIDVKVTVADFASNENWTPNARAVTTSGSTTFTIRNMSAADCNGYEFVKSYGADTDSNGYTGYADLPGDYDEKSYEYGNHPLFSFNTTSPGVEIMYCDWIKLDYTFYDHDTGKEIDGEDIQGTVTFRDIDYAQSISVSPASTSSTGNGFTALYDYGGTINFESDIAKGSASQSIDSGKYDSLLYSTWTYTDADNSTQKYWMASDWLGVGADDEMQSQWFVGTFKGSFSVIYGNCAHAEGNSNAISGITKTNTNTENGNSKQRTWTVSGSDLSFNGTVSKRVAKYSPLSYTDTANTLTGEENSASTVKTWNRWLYRNSSGTANLTSDPIIQTSDVSGNLTIEKYVKDSSGTQKLASSANGYDDFQNTKNVYFVIKDPNGKYVHYDASESDPTTGTYKLDANETTASYTGTFNATARFQLGTSGKITISNMYANAGYTVEEVYVSDTFIDTYTLPTTITQTANGTTSTVNYGDAVTVTEDGTTVKIVNSEGEPGSLTFTKYYGVNTQSRKVLSSANNADANDEVSFAIVRKDSDSDVYILATGSDGVYTFSHDGVTVEAYNKNPSTPSSYRTLFKLSDAGTITVSNLPEGDYYIEEVDTSDEFTGTMTDVSFTITSGSSTKASGMNYLPSGTGTFTKTVKDSNGTSMGTLTSSSDYADVRTDLKFQLLDSSGNVVKVEGTSGVYLYNTSSSNTTMTLSTKGTITINQLPVGTYYIKETSSADIFNGTISNVKLTITADNTTSVTGANTLYPMTGTLQFTKAIKDADGNVTDSSAASSSAWSSLKFMIVRTSDGTFVTATKNSTGSYTYTGTASQASATTFTLNSSHQFTVADMPEGGKYTVVETSTDYDIFTGLMSSVTGTIVADKTTSLTGYNQLKETGDLKFTKYYGVNNQSRKVLSSTNDSDLNAAVSFVIVREADDIVDNDIYIIATGSDGVYTYSGHGRPTSASITSYGTNNGASLFELSDAGTISVSGLPEGDYYIKEIDTSDEFKGTMADVSFTITGGETTNKEGMNYLKSGSLRFTKEAKDWNGNNIGTLDSDLEDEYDIDGAISSLTFKLVDTSTGKYVTVSSPTGGVYLYNTSVTTTEMKLTTLGGFAVTNLPLGTYSVVETSTDEEIFVGTMTSVSGTITNNATTSITGTNTLKQPTGTLQFTKAVKDEDGNVTDSSVLTSTVRGKLQFAVTDASNKNALVYATKNSDGTYTYAKNSSVSGATSVFTLDSKNQITIYKMPADTKYTVVETKTDTDTFTGLMTQVSGTVLKDETLSLTGYNQVLPEIGSFTITKKLTKAYYTDEEFVYEITQTDKSGNKTKFLAYISIPAGKTTGSITIDGAVSTYTYTVKEMDNNWRYTAVNDSTYLNVNGTKVTALSNTTLKSYINYSKNNSQNSMTFKLKYPKTNSFNCIFANEGHDYWLDDGTTVTNVMESIS